MIEAAVSEELDKLIEAVGQIKFPWSETPKLPSGVWVAMIDGCACPLSSLSIDAEPPEIHSIMGVSGKVAQFMGRKRSEKITMGFMNAHDMIRDWMEEIKMGWTTTYKKEISLRSSQSTTVCYGCFPISIDSEIHGSDILSTVSFSVDQIEVIT